LRSSHQEKDDSLEKGDNQDEDGNLDKDKEQGQGLDMGGSQDADEDEGYNDGLVRLAPRHQ
jgi:hypothetical protein